MTYGSICSGIEAATVAWRPLGWKAAWFAEIEPFPSAVLAHHYPDVPNLGDFTKINESEPIDLLVGGTPCQSFSVAGKRLGLDDPRGNLTIEWLRLVQRLLPRWLVWENVPGVLSDDGGRTFGAILGTLGQLGYGFAYRVLDAKGFGVPQQRRRVFVVGHLGDWRRAAAVLFERGSLSGHPLSSRAAWANPAASGEGKAGIVCFDENQISSSKNRSNPRPGGACHALTTYRPPTIATMEFVRRLTPLECESLQGFPGGYSNIGGAAPGPRYAAVGGSMAVPVMRWIGERIDQLEAA